MTDHKAQIIPVMTQIAIQKVTWNSLSKIANILEVDSGENGRSYRLDLCLS